MLYVISLFMNTLNHDCLDLIILFFVYPDNYDLDPGLGSRRRHSVDNIKQVSKVFHNICTSNRLWYAVTIGEFADELEEYDAMIGTIIPNATYYTKYCFLFDAYNFSWNLYPHRGKRLGYFNHHVLHIHSRSYKSPLVELILPSIIVKCNAKEIYIVNMYVKSTRFLDRFDKITFKNCVIYGSEHFNYLKDTRDIDLSNCVMGNYNNNGHLSLTCPNFD